MNLFWNNGVKISPKNAGKDCMVTTVEISDLISERAFCELKIQYCKYISTYVQGQSIQKP
jgi:hypothetical protein